MTVEIKISLDRLPGNNLSVSIQSIEENCGKTTTKQIYHGELADWVRENYPDCPWMLEADTSLDPVSQEIEALIDRYSTEAERLILARSEQPEFIQEILDRMTSSDREKLTQLYQEATGMERHGTPTPHDLLQNFLKDLEAKVKPLYGEAISLLWAQALEQNKLRSRLGLPEIGGKNDSNP
jgi:hypothetical protein